MFVKISVYKMIIGTIMLLLSADVLSACNSIACDSTVKRVFASSDGGGTIFVEPHEATSALNCRLRSDVYLTLKTSHPLFREIYSMLLTSIATDASMKLRINENSNGCTISYAVIYSQK